MNPQSAPQVVDMQEAGGQRKAAKHNSMDVLAMRTQSAAQQPQQLPIVRSSGAAVLAWHPVIMHDTCHAAHWPQAGYLHPGGHGSCLWLCERACEVCRSKA